MTISVCSCNESALLRNQCHSCLSSTIKTCEERIEVLDEEIMELNSILEQAIWFQENPERKVEVKDIHQHIYIHKPSETTIYVGVTDKELENKHFAIEETQFKWSYLQSRYYVDLPQGVQEAIYSETAKEVNWDLFKESSPTIAVIFQEEMLKFGIRI